MTRATTSNASRIEPKKHDGSENPTLSVIVPVYNSAEQLEQCLGALEASCGTQFEVIVVDDGSTQPIKPLVRRFGFRYMRIDGPGGPARARNRGAVEATGTHLVFIDADVCVHQDALLRMSEAFVSNPSIDAVVGTYDDAPAEPGFLSQYKNLFHHFVHQASSGPISTFWSGCGAVRRDVFLKFGGFDEKRYRRPAIEDIELGTWMTAAGHRIILDQHIRCKHLKRWTLGSLLKTDILDRGIPWTRLMLRAKHMPTTLNTEPTQLASVAFVYFTLLALLATFRWRYAWLSVVMGLAAVTILNCDFYQYFLARRGWWFTLRAAPLHWLYFIYCGFCAATGTILHVLIDKKNAAAVPAGDVGELLEQEKTSRWLITGLIGLALFLYGRGVTTSAPFAGDALHHLMNGIFIHDAINDAGAALAHPIDYAFEYYRHYPAVNLGYYPPVFHTIEAAVMFINGVSPASAQIAVLLMALLLTYYAFAWFRLYFDPIWSAVATIVLISTPLLVHWGHDIMLEVPVLAFMMGAVWAFECILRRPHPGWRECSLCALFTVLALWTKQHALMLLGIFAVSLVASGKWRYLKRAPVLTAACIIVLAAAGLIATTFYLGGDAVSYSVGTQAQTSRFTTEQWTFYLQKLPEIVGWPTLVPAVVGVLMLPIRRTPYFSLALAWVVIFYVMHSYFLAQDVRYGCLWIPPFCLLAAFALKNLISPLARRPRRARLGGALVAVFAFACIVRGAQVNASTLPGAYQKAAEDLIETMPPFSCLTFLPDRPGRMAVCYRLAVETRKANGNDLYSFGQIMRADQVLRDWENRWPNAAAMAQTLKQWDVGFIIVESPRPIKYKHEAKTNQAIESLLALGELKEYRRYPVSYEANVLPERTLILYQWAAPIPFSQSSRPTIQTRRIPTLIQPPVSR